MGRRTRKAELIRNNVDEIRGGAFPKVEHAAETGKRRVPSSGGDFGTSRCRSKKILSDRLIDLLTD